jgi:hypothetical protein
MLLYDNCAEGWHHIYNLAPALIWIPHGNWLCSAHVVMSQMPLQLYLQAGNGLFCPRWRGYHVARA